MTIPMSAKHFSFLSIAGLLATAGTVGLFAYLLTINSPLPPGTPVALVGVLLLPGGWAVQILFKLQELKDSSNLKGLSQAEIRRLSAVVDRRSTQVTYALIFYIAAGIIAGAGFYFSQNNPQLTRNMTVLLGVLIGCVLFSVFLLYAEVREISDFKALINNRHEKRRRQREHLEKLRSQ